MGKTEKGTPKDLANKMKAKGLQKLRWYCQMCEKQCRDENGFKCHTMSESHQRQLLLFAENPDKYLDSFSEEFMEGYTNLLKRRFGTKRVHANNVYQEYIQDREHIHMNATQWETLTDFVKWLGREGIAIVDETEKGWYVAYVDRDPETLRRQEKMAKREKFEKDEEERFQEFVNRQVEMGKAKGETKVEYTELKRSEEETISLNMKIGFTKPIANSEISKNVLVKSSSGSNDKLKEKFKREEKKRSALDDIMEEEKRVKKMKEEEAKRLNPAKSKEPSEPAWIVKDIIVKVVAKQLGSKYYKQKGVIRDVIDRYIAVVKLNECGTKLKVDQAQLETVVPSVGRKVLVVMGKYKGEIAELKSIQEDSFSATLKLEKDGKVVDKIPYEQFCKVQT